MTCIASFFRASTLLIASVAPAQIVCMATGPDPIANPPFPPMVPGFTVAGGYTNLAPPVDGKCPPNPSPCKFSFDFNVSIAAAAPPQPALDLCLGVPLFPPLLCSLLTNPPWNVTNPLPDLTKLVLLVCRYPKTAALASSGRSGRTAPFRPSCLPTCDSTARGVSQ